ncbi:unnamed protein product [Symbiodinium natans]|uniref:Uncharacterized protein n=1 Tax=Symbiodinium natans TaxID=878477 RepID=A0A812LZN0_9DINO|nr:unnamed protein product [Symbiodinium natans]
MWRVDEEEEASSRFDSGSDSDDCLLPVWSDVESEATDCEFLRDACLQCKLAAFLQFLAMPLVYFLGYLGCRDLAAVTIVVLLFASGAFQFRLKDRLLEWLRCHPQEAWQELTQATAELEASSKWLPCLSTGSLAFVKGIYEAVDPAMDAFAAGNSRHMYTKDVERGFQVSWRRAPLIGPAVAGVGLPGVLLLILVAATTCQIYKLVSETVRLERKIASMEAEYPAHAREAASWRWQMWIRMAHVTDVGGLMLLHYVYQQLVRVEIARYPHLWPIVDRNAAFEVKTFMEAVPSLWFQISLVGLTYDTASTENLVVTFASITTGALTVGHILFLETSVLRHLSHLGELFTQKQWAFLLAYVGTLCCWSACMVRLLGVWICPGHILNVESGCQQSFEGQRI